MRVLDPARAIRYRPALVPRLCFERPDNITSEDIVQAAADAARAGTFKKLPRSEGVYLLLNMQTGAIYIGRAVDMLSRVRVHISQLRSGKHPNPKLQEAFNQCGEDSFGAAVVSHTRGRWSDLAERIAIARLDKDSAYNLAGVDSPLWSGPLDPVAAQKAAIYSAETSREMAREALKERRKLNKRRERQKEKA